MCWEKCTKCKIVQENYCICVPSQWCLHYYMAHELSAIILLHKYVMYLTVFIATSQGSDFLAWSLLKSQKEVFTLDPPQFNIYLAFHKGYLLRGTETERDREDKPRSCQLGVHFLNACTRAVAGLRIEPGSGKSVQVSWVGGRRPRIWYIA